MSREKRYTPGCWVARAHRVLLNDNLIASCWAPRLPDECRREGESWLDMRDRTRAEREAIEAKQKANARLISAAPDMVEALEPFVKYGKRMLSAHRQAGGFMLDAGTEHEAEITRADFQRAIDALAKALGQGGAE